MRKLSLAYTTVFTMLLLAVVLDGSLSSSKLILQHNFWCGKTLRIGITHFCSLLGNCKVDVLLIGKVSFVGRKVVLFRGSFIGGSTVVPWHMHSYLHHWRSSTAAWWLELQCWLPGLALSQNLFQMWINPTENEEGGSNDSIWKVPTDSMGLYKLSGSSRMGIVKENIGMPLFCGYWTSMARGRDGKGVLLCHVESEVHANL